MIDLFKVKHLSLISIPHQHPVGHQHRYHIWHQCPIRISSLCLCIFPWPMTHYFVQRIASDDIEWKYLVDHNLFPVMWMLMLNRSVEIETNVASVITYRYLEPDRWLWCTDPFGSRHKFCWIFPLKRKFCHFRSSSLPICHHLTILCCWSIQYSVVLI